MLDSWWPIVVIAATLLVLLAFIALPWLKNKSTREPALVAVATAFFLSMALYMYVGSPFNLAAFEAQKTENQELRQQIGALREKLATEAGKEDGGLWAQLGAAYIQTEQYPQAAAALKEAVKLTEGQPQLILMYGKAQMMAADGDITDGAKQAFEMAAKLMPDNPDPLLMLAMERMQAGDKPAARAYMQKLLPLLPDAAPIKQVIIKRLKEAEK